MIVEEEDSGRGHRAILVATLAHRGPVLPGREGITRDLHDTVIQWLFAIGSRRQGAARIEPAIFGPEGARRASGGLHSRVLSLAGEAGGALGFDPQALFDGPVDSLDDDLATEVLAVPREALANAGRHVMAPSGPGPN